MRIGVNALFLIPGGVGGTEIYTRALLAALARADSHNEYHVYRNRETGPDLVPNAPNFHDRPQPLRATSRPLRIAYEQIVLPLAFARDRIDLVLNCGITAPLFARQPMITVFYDVQYKRFGAKLRPLERLVTQTLFPLSARRSARLVLMSRAAEHELLGYYPFARGKTLIVPHGIDPAFRDVAARRVHRSRAARPFILAVSSLMAHKNFGHLLESLVLLRASGLDIGLTVAGIRGADTERLEALRDALGLHAYVLFTGWIPRADLLELFATTDAFVFPSLYEGFGIPVLEALTAGIPLACSDLPVLREIAGDAAVYFDPNEPASIADALRLALGDRAIRDRAFEAGPARAQHFDWDANVATLIEAYAAPVRPR